MTTKEEMESLDVLLAHMPADIARTFTPEQRAALLSVAKPLSWRRYPIDIRLSRKLFGRRYFVTVVAGQERRSFDRIERERVGHPLRTASNVLFMVGVGGAFYFVAVMLIVIFSSLIEF